MRFVGAEMVGGGLDDGTGELCVERGPEPASMLGRAEAVGVVIMFWEECVRRGSSRGEAIVDIVAALIVCEAEYGYGKGCRGRKFVNS